MIDDDDRNNYCNACLTKWSEHHIHEDTCHQLQAAREEAAEWRARYYEVALLIYHDDRHKQN